MQPGRSPLEPLPEPSPAVGGLAFDLERRFPGGPVVRAALDEALPDGSVLVLFGASGSGKTTVLRCLAGLGRPDRGTIRFRGETWLDVAAGRFVEPQHRGIGLVFQDYALFPHLSVAQNIGFALRRAPRAAAAVRVLELARLLRVEDLLARRPLQLSGGQQQRVALARALAPSPRLLLLDEPLSAVDAPTRSELRGELRAILQRTGLPTLVVTHDRLEALALGDRLAVLTADGVRQVGPVHEVFSSPCDHEVARVVGTETVVPATLLERRDGLARVAVGSRWLWAVDPGHLQGEAYACIRAEDVLLEPGPANLTSARNALEATVRTVAVEGPLVRVVLDCGFRLVALVTRDSAERLEVVPGRAVTALVKAPAVRVVPRQG